MDTPETTHLSLCAGYGGIDLGLRRVLPDVRTVAYVEIEAFAVANLVAKMEAGELDAAPVWTNLKTLPLEVFRGNVSIVSGGFPCQPFSAAGKREGDDDPRHLFPYVKNAVRIIQPEWVFLENVEGIISAKLKSDGWSDPVGTPVLLHVLRELERVGYQCAWGVFSAAEVGAPHQRKRVFILARRLGDPSGAGLQGQLSPGEPCQEGRKEPDGRAAPTSGVRSNGELRASGLEQSPSNRWPSRPGQAQQEWEEPRVIRAVGNADCLGSRETSRSQDCGNGELANRKCERLEGQRNDKTEQHWENEGVQSRPENGGDKHTGQAEPVMGGATNGPTSGLDPTANRVDRLRLLGNGVVPQTAEVAFRTLYEELTR